MQTTTFKTLSEIFSETDTVEFGPFEIIKPFSASWRQATTLIDGDEILLNPEHKKILAALSAQPDHKLTCGEYAAIMEKPSSSLKTTIRLMMTHISLLKSQLREFKGNDYSDLIHPIRLGAISSAQRGYYLQQDFNDDVTIEPDILEWSNFRMTKAPHAGWETSRFYVGGTEITLPSRTKLFLSMMFEKPDHKLTVGDVSDFYMRQGEDISLQSANVALRAINNLRLIIRENIGNDSASQIYAIGRPGMSGLPLRQKGYFLQASPALEQQFS